MLWATENGSVDLYYDNSKKLETTSYGVAATGEIGMSAVSGTNNNHNSSVLFQKSDNRIDGGSGLLYNPANDQLLVNGLSITSAQVRASGAGPLHLTTANGNGTVDLYVHTDKVVCNGHLLPGSDNTDNLGSSSLRWANVYTYDLNLNNEGSQNDVDGTWGSWTIQEGQDDLFLLNRRNGKKYKFNLTEVS